MFGLIFLLGFVGVIVAIAWNHISTTRPLKRVAEYWIKYQDERLPYIQYEFDVGRLRAHIKEDDLHSMFGLSYVQAHAIQRVINARGKDVSFPLGNIYGHLVKKHIKQHGAKRVR